MAEFFTDQIIRILVVAFPIFVALLCQYSTFPIPDDSPGPRRELTASEETVVQVSFIVGLFTGVLGLPFLQHRLLYVGNPSSKFLFFWDSSMNSFLPLIGLFLQGFFVAFLLQLALVRACFGTRFHSEILNASLRPKRSHHPRFEMPWAFDPRKVRVFIWLAACLSIPLTLASLGTYVHIDRGNLHQNIFWAGEKQFPIETIDALEIVSYRTQKLGTEWEVYLRFSGGNSVKLLEAFGRLPRWQVDAIIEALGQAKGLPIPVHERSTQK